MSIIKQIRQFYKNNKTILFTTPSHSLGNYIIPAAKRILGTKFFESDFSEIEGFDNLRNPQGALKKLQDTIANIYSAKSSFVLTNGSTSGICAAMLATLNANDKVLIARNCHISVYNGLVLTGAHPIWFMPEFDKEWGIYKGVSAKDINSQLNKNKDIKAVIITSPTYEGNFSETQKISKLCKQHDIVLIVDEAHGALLNFYNLNSQTAIKCGADIAIQSLHKTAGAPNPCALLHISNKISTDKIQNSLNLINTTSPSYPLIAATEAAVMFLNSKSGQNKIKKLIKDIDKLKKQLDKNIQVYSGNNDITKILIKFDNIDSLDAAEILNNSYQIEEEYSNLCSMLFITGIGTDLNKLNKLSKALNKIAKLPQKEKNKFIWTYKIPKMQYSPRDAFFKKAKTIPVELAEGKICAEAIVPYPPGIPIILPGEIITKDSFFNIGKKEIKVIS